MPMPPMPTKWIVPMSVPKAFIIEGVQTGDSPSSRGHSADRRLSALARAEDRSDQNRGEPAADALHEVGEVARGVRPADGERARGGVAQRDRVHRQLLDLPRQHLGSEVRLL